MDIKLTFLLLTSLAMVQLSAAKVKHPVTSTPKETTTPIETTSFEEETTGPTTPTPTTPDICAWGYDLHNGPSTWGHRGCPEYAVCGSGISQSPIDLPRGKQIYADENHWMMEKVLTYQAIEYSSPYFTSTITGALFNNGHSVVFQPPVLDSSAFTIKGKPYGDEVYQFLQLHFHWGSDNSQGSEHTIGGRSAPLELHMVHINTKYVNEDGSLNPDYAVNPDGLAVLGFMFRATRRSPNGAMESIVDGIDYLINHAGKRAGAAAVTDITIDFADLIQNKFMGEFYTYTGSLTTPGCNEVVTWVVFTGAMKVTNAQLDMFRQLEDHHGQPIVNNYRPPQPLNGRQIGYGNFMEN